MSNNSYTNTSQSEIHNYVKSCRKFKNFKSDAYANTAVLCITINSKIVQSV